MKEEPPLDYKCRDKFLVQSVALDHNPGPDEALATLWSSIEKTSKGSIQEKKIRVTFLSPTGSSSSGTNGIKNGSDEKPPSYSASSPSPQFGSPAPTEKSTVAESARSVADSTAAVIPTSAEELKAQLAAAQKQIAKLTQDLKDPVVRQRKVAEAQEKVQTVVQQSQDSGVPLHIAAALCLVSFLIAYLFF
jgi:hypothetical protein